DEILPCLLTRDRMVTYDVGHGRGLQSPRRSDAPEAARRAVQAGRADAHRSRAAVADDPLRRDEAPQGARRGESRGHETAWPREAPLSESCPDPARPPPLGEQIRRALGSTAERAQERPG